MSGTKNALSPQSDTPHLEIVEGLHHGVRVALEDSEYLVGLNAECDIVLRDDGVLPRHALLRIDGNDARIEAVGGDVTVGSLKVAIGQGCRVRLPVVVAIGGAKLQLLPARPQGAFAALTATMKNQPAKVAGGVLVCALAVAVVAKGLRSPEPAPAPLADASTVEQNFSETRNAGSSAPANFSPAAAKAAAEELNGKLKEAGITTLKVGAGVDRLAVSGRLNEQQASGWAEIQRWFDARFAGSMIMTANVAIGPMEGPAPVRLQAVWFGQRPYIIADNGSRYYEGAVLDSGWIVQRIADDRVILNKDTETLALTYR
jgi:type III secretion system (T3SS) inner membrane Yop/YscD-like protein/type III secretion system (T3SS) inner membrane Yop/CscD-like protein